ncbi:MAG: hypothetical protein JWN80_651 [Microbacteriaceae bacterium]|nr:hypothetical protein [Microbacteriaceae bacterium]
MEIDAFLADSAESVQGKLYAMGMGWNSIFTGGFPFAQSRIALGITVQVPYNETNEPHSLRVHLEDEDGGRRPLGVDPQSGAPIAQLNSSFTVGRPPQLLPGDAQMISFAMNFDQLPFDRPAMFNWVVSIDGEAVKRLPMRISLAA